MADASATVKKVQITGGAAESFMTGQRKTRRRPLRGLPVAAKEGGGGASTPSPNPLPLPEVKTPPVGADLKPQATGAPILTAAPESKQEGGSKKVILEPSKTRKSKKVILALPKKVTKLPSGPSATMKPDAKPSEATSKTETTTLLKKPATKGRTHKVARRIRVSVDGLSKRIHRAKTIKKESQKMSLEDIKKELIKSRLIKADSKAPEAILRQMYNDFETLKQRAL